MLISQLDQLDLTKIIYTFGSNTAGIHGKGSALTARRYFGAKLGQGEGLCGTSSYAIPTKDDHLKTLSIDNIHSNIGRFLNTTELMDDYHFFVSKIGCGLAGIPERQIIDIFDDYFERYYERFIKNVTLPVKWQIELGIEENRPFTLVCGSRSITSRRTVEQILNDKVSDKAHIISGGAPGVDVTTSKWAVANGRTNTEVKAPWDVYPGDKGVGIMRNWIMSSMATECLAIWDGISPGTQRMMTIAESEKLNTTQIRINL